LKLAALAFSLPIPLWRKRFEIRYRPPFAVTSPRRIHAACPMKLFLAAIVVVLFVSSVGQARQYAAADEMIVHTRRAPVVVHRVSPPFHGRHIYRPENNPSPR
jgi:hypothetical protein